MEPSKRKTVFIIAAAIVVVTVAGIIFYNVKRYSVKDPKKNNRKISLIRNKNA